MGRVGAPGAQRCHGPMRPDTCLRVELWKLQEFMHRYARRTLARCLSPTGVGMGKTAGGGSLRLDKTENPLL